VGALALSKPASWEDVISPGREKNVMLKWDAVEKLIFQET
jgi:hypothetical protein